MNPSRQFIESILLPLYQPRPVDSIAEWCKAQRIIFAPSVNRTYAGSQYDPENMPAATRLIFDFLQHSSEGNELVIMKDSQSCGFTTTISIAIGWLLQHRPGNTALWLDIGKNVDDVIREKIDPIWDAIPYTRRQSREFRKREQTIHRRIFPGAFVHFLNAGSASGFISKSVSYAFLDECGKHPIIDGVTSVTAARKRLTADDNSRLVAGSKPETEIDDEDDPDRPGKRRLVLRQDNWFHAEYCSGTQEKYHVPCPMCGHLQELKWSNIIFSHCKENLPGFDSRPLWNQARIRSETYYRCANETCQASGPGTTAPTHHPDARWANGRIDESWKKWMALNGQWTPTPNAERERRDLYPHPHPRRRSAHISALYNIAFASVTWGNLALEWINAQGDSAALRAFFCDRLGRPEPRVKFTDISAKHILRLISKEPRYNRLHLQHEISRRIQMPITPEAVGMLVDVQQGHVKWLLVAYTAAGGVWVLDWGKCITFEELEDLLDMPLKTPDGIIGHVDKLVIDARHRTKSVLKFCQHHYPRTIPVWGDNADRSKKKSDLWSNTHNVGSPDEIDVVWLDADAWEEELYHQRLAQGSLSAPSAEHPPITFPTDIVDYPEFIAEITNMHEVWVKTQTGAIRKAEWQKIRRQDPNDWGDCLKWSLVLWKILTEGIPRT